MKYAFTENVRHTLARARDEAQALAHDFVGPEHMLLGLTRVEASRGVAMLGLLGLEAVEIRGALQVMLRPGSETGRAGDLPYTSGGKKVLELALAETRDRKDAHVGTEHLLVGIVREQRNPAARLLAARGVTLPRVRAALERVLSGDMGEPLPPVAEAPQGVWYLELDAQSGTPIYEQIISRIEEAVATGQLEPGERLPSVRDLAAELGIAPGTAARAYSILEERGVVHTDRARGTRVAETPPSSARPTRTVDWLEGLLRRTVVAAFHRGATAQHVRDALERAMNGILRVL